MINDIELFSFGHNNRDKYEDEEDNEPSTSRVSAPYAIMLFKLIKNDHIFLSPNTDWDDSWEVKKTIPTFKTFS